MAGSALILASIPWLVFQGCVLAAAALLALWRARRSDAGLVVLLGGVALVAATVTLQEAGQASLPGSALLALKAGHWIGGALELSGIAAGLLGLQRRHAYLLAAALAGAGLLSFGVAVAALT